MRATWVCLLILLASAVGAATGAFLSDLATGTNGPTRMKIGPDSLVYVLQWLGAGTVPLHQADGTLVGEFTTGDVPERIGIDWDLPRSIGIDWDATGSLYISYYDGDLARKFDSHGVDQGLFIDNGLVGPTNIWFDAGGDLLVADYR